MGEDILPVCISRCLILSSSSTRWEEIVLLASCACVRLFVVVTLCVTIVRKFLIACGLCRCFLIHHGVRVVGDNGGEGGYARTGTGWNQRSFGPLQGTVAQVAGIGPRGWITKGWKGIVQYEEQ